MKRHFQPEPPVVVHLSVEEEAILADTQSEATIGLDDASAEVDRISDVATIAGDAVQIVDETPELGTVEQNLVGAVADMAVAGTDAAPEEVLAVAAATDGEGLTTEGIASALKSIWDSIITSIKNMWVGIKHWFTTYFSSLEQNKRHAEELIKKFGNMKGKVAGGGDIGLTDIFDYGGYAGVKLMLGGGTRQRKAIQAMVISAAENQHALMMPIGEGLIEAFNDVQVIPSQGEGVVATIDITKMDGVVKLLSENMAKYCEKLGMKSTSKGYESDGKDAGVKIYVKNFSPNHVAEGTDNATKIANLGRVRFGAEQQGGGSGEITMKMDCTPEMLAAGAKEVLDFVNTLLQIKADFFNALEQQSEKVDKACEAMLGRLKEDNPKAVSMGKRMMPLASAYANWVTQPSVKLFSIAARHNKWWLTLYEKTSNAFNDAPVA